MRLVRQFSTNIRQTQSIKDVGLKQFMTKVYTKMALGVAATVGTSLTMMPLMTTFHVNPFIPFGIGAVSMFGSIYGLTSSKPTYLTKEENGEIIHYTENSTSRELSFWGLSVGMGTMMSPMVTMVMENDPVILPASLLLSGYIFGGCALFASKTKNTKILEWKAPLMIGLTSLIGIQLVGIGANIIMGHNALSSMIHSVDIYGGIGLFTIMSIYDAYLAKKMYLEGDADHLGCTVNLYLDFMNLLIRIMEALAKAKQK